MNFKGLNICLKKSRRQGSWRGICLTRSPNTARAPCCYRPHPIAGLACITRSTTITMAIFLPCCISLKTAANTSEIVKFVREFPDTFLDLEKARTYQPLEPANPRLRGLLAETVDRGMWRLLWIPPSLNYYALAGPFAAPELANLTKRL